MRRLPFERDYLLDFERCEPCAGSGAVNHAGYNQPRTCWSCRGLGRKITREGRELFYEICELLGKPVLEKESRIKPKHLQTVLGSLLRPGMYVKPMRRPIEKPRVIEAIEELPGGWRRIRFADGAIASTSSLDTFERELTDAEVARSNTIMADYVGRGAVCLEAGSTVFTRR